MSNQRQAEYDKIILNSRKILEFSSYSEFVNLFEKSVTDISFFLNRRDRFKLFNLNKRTEFEIQIRNAIFSRIALGMEDKKEFIENFYFAYFANSNEILPSQKNDQEKFNYVLSTSLHIKSEKIFNDINSIKSYDIPYFIINFLFYYIKKNQSFEDFNNNYLFFNLLEKFEINNYLNLITKNRSLSSQQYDYFFYKITPFFEMIDNKKLLENF